MYPSTEDNQLSYDNFMHAADSEYPYSTALQPAPIDPFYFDHTPVDNGDAPLEPSVCVADAFSQYTKMVDAHRNANTDSWTHTPTEGLAPLDLWRSSTYSEDFSSALPSAVCVNKPFFLTGILTARYSSRSPELLSPGDPNFREIYQRSTMPSALEEPYGSGFPSPQLSDVSLSPPSTTTSLSDTSSSNLDFISPPQPPPTLRDPHCTMSPEASFAPLPPASDSASSSSASDSGESFVGIENPYSPQIDPLPLGSDWTAGSEHHCHSRPSEPARRRKAAGTMSSAGRRKRSVTLSPNQRKCKVFRATSSPLKATSTSSSSSRHTSPATSLNTAATERFIPEVNCTLRVVPGKMVHTKSRTPQKDVDCGNTGLDLEENQCEVCFKKFSRPQDVYRHLRRHGQTELICCDGVPLGEAAEHGIILRDHDVVNSWPHTDQLTVGGCGKVLARPDALTRHFLKYPSCKERRVGSKKVKPFGAPRK